MSRCLALGDDPTAGYVPNILLTVVSAIGNPDWSLLDTIRAVQTRS